MGNAVQQRLRGIQFGTFQKAKLGLKEYKMNSKIEKNNRRSYEKEDMKVKILLLGPGESGKSTLFRQFRLLYGRNNLEDCDTTLKAVYGHTLLGMKQLILNTPREELEKIDKRSVEIILNVSRYQEIDEIVGNALKNLWNDLHIKQTWCRRNEFQIYETTEHFLDNIDIIMKKDYVPTLKDILHVRYKTNGVKSEKFSLFRSEFEVYDVAGQRNERSKWIHCFDNVTAIIFVAAISEYDQVLFEDFEKNRLQESIDLFAEVCNNESLKDPSLILYLNKIDLFQAKIQAKNLNSVPAFSDYDGDLGDVDGAIEYIIELFLARNTTQRTIYNHIVCALDTQSVRDVFELCKHALLERNLQATGFSC